MHRKTTKRYIAYDPQEDTETSRSMSRCSTRYCYIAYDPQEDTETAVHDDGGGGVGGYIAYDPQEDTETFWRVSGMICVRMLHRLRSARGY